MTGMDDAGSTHWKPYPEIVDDTGLPYTVVDSRVFTGVPTVGFADKVSRIVAVPLDATGREVARHELAHVRWSDPYQPKSCRDIPKLVLQAVEDARINLGLQHAGIPLAFSDSLRVEVLELAADDLAHERLGAFLLRSIASAGTNLRQAILHEHTHLIRPSQMLIALHAETVDRLEKARRRNGELVATPSQTLRVARWLAQMLRELGLPVPHGRDGGIGCCGIGVGRASSRPIRRGRDAASVVPGCMRIVRVPLSQRVRPRPSGRGWIRRPTSAGLAMAFPERFAGDRAVFGVRRRGVRGVGGTVLIDVSGSMALAGSEIASIVARAPAAIVAIYSGDGGEGELRIIVRNGRRAADHHLTPPGKGNVVDVPALEWLTRQPRPRIWISDGVVTGCGDVQGLMIRARCAEITRRGSIVRVPDVEGASAALGLE